MTTKYDALVQAVEGAHEAQIYDGPTWEVLKAAKALVAESPTAADVSDGYHTLDDYDRKGMLLNAAMFYTWHKYLPGFGVHKSRQHHDEITDPIHPGYFIVVAQLPTGQISYHYPIEHWDLFDIEEWGRPAIYDGHTAAQVEERIEAWLRR